MTTHRFIRIAAIAGMLAAGAIAAGCSKSSSPTGPTPGGSGNTPFDSGNLTAPSNYVRTFPDAGSVGYHCTIHRSAGMVGTVVISSSGADSAVVTASGTTFAPATVTIKPGKYVHWKITGGTHTVTSD